MRLRYLSHRWPAKAQASLRVRAVSPEPLLFALMMYGSRRRVRPNIRHLAPLDGCACAFEEWVYGGRKVPQSHELAHFEVSWLSLQYYMYTEDKRNATLTWAASWQNQRNDCALNEDADQPGHTLCAQWIAKVPSFLHADSDDTDQSGWMPTLIWVFAGHTCHFVGFVMRRLT